MEEILALLVLAVFWVVKTVWAALLVFMGVGMRRR